jgi:hypothetical protein
MCQGSGRVKRNAECRHTGNLIRSVRHFCRSLQMNGCLIKLPNIKRISPNHRRLVDNSCPLLRCAGGNAEEALSKISTLFRCVTDIPARWHGKCSTSTQQELSTERGHDQATVKRLKENVTVFHSSWMRGGSQNLPVLRCGRDHDPFSFFAAFASRIFRHCSSRSPIIFSYPRSVGR